MAFKFSDVLIPFKTQIGGVLMGIDSMKDSLKDFSKFVDKFNKDFTEKINGPLDKNNQPFKPIENSTLRVIDRMSRFLTAISSVKDAIGSVFGTTSSANAAFDSFAQGLRVAANLAQAFTGVLGLAAAGIAGLTAAVIFFLAEITQAQIKATEASTEGTIKSQERMERFKNKLEDITKVSKAFNDTFGEEAAQAFAANRSALETALEDQRKLELQQKAAGDTLRKVEADVEHFGDIIGDVFETITFGNLRIGDNLGIGKWFNTTAMNAAKQGLATVNVELEDTKKRITDITATGNILKLVEHFGKLSTELKNLQEQLKDFQTKAPALQKVADILSPKAGFFTNLSEDQRIANAKQFLEIRSKILATTLDELQAAKELLDVVNSRLSIDAGNKTLQDEQARLQQRVNQLDAAKGTAISGVLDAQREKNAAEAGKEFSAAFTKPLTDAIGSAVIDGIVNGKKGAEILADITKNLMTNALNDVFKHLQQGLIDVFKSVAGAGGEILGSALTAVVGIVAGVISHKKGGSDQFDTIQNQIESTQAVRGVVAGPTNVAIATVGENLKRANAGIEARLDVLIQVAIQIRDNGGTAPLAGAVATP